VQPKTLLKKTYASLPLAIALLKPLLDDTSVRVEEQYTRVRHTPVAVLLGDAVRRMLLIDVLVQQAEGAHDVTPMVGEEGIGDSVPVGKPAEHVHRIIAHGEESNILAREVGYAALQLDELRLAEGSPGRAAVEHHQGTPSATRLMEIHGMAMLIR